MGEGGDLRKQDATTLVAYLLQNATVRFSQILIDDHESGYAAVTQLFE
jgi:hypothetical protein